jgi:hypothetical protein
MSQARNDKAAPATPPSPVSAGRPSLATTLFGARTFDDEDEVAVGLPPPARGEADAAGQARRTATVDLTNKRKIVLVAGRGKTGKTTQLRWMAERAHNAGRPVLLGDIDPTNASFSSYFEDVHRPPDAGDPAVAVRWLERFLQHAMTSDVSALVDLGGGSTTLNRLVDEVPSLADMLTTGDVAPVMLYMLGPQVDDLSPLATLEGRAFQPAATALVLNESAVEPGQTREEAFARVYRHSAFLSALNRGAVPLWMPRLLVAEEIEAKRLHFIQARDAIPRPGTRQAPLGAFDRARVRFWLDAMDREFTEVASWLP